MSQAALASENSGRSAPMPEGRRFRPGESGNPGGRPKGVARRAREAIHDNPMELLDVFLEVARDPEQKASDRISAAREYLDRAYGKAPAYTPVEGDPLDLADPLDNRITAVLDDLATRREARPTGEGEAGTLATDGQVGAAAA